MSIQTLYTAATGMESLQTKLDVIANNLANIESIAFKRDRANFEDVFYRHDILPGIQDNFGNYTPIGINVGLGSRLSGVQTDISQGTFDITNNQLDVAIEGLGYFQVNDPNTGQFLFTRSGNFSINANGQIVMGSARTGRLIDPPITIPLDATDIAIGADGQVSVLTPNSNQLQQVGQIQLVQFINPQGLLKIGENLYRQTDASGPATPGIPGQQGLGVLRQGSLENSNVSPVEELIDLIMTQRAFELNSQTIQAGDQMLQLLANLRRF